MKNISLQYQDLTEGKMDRHQFLRNARMMFPSFVTNHNSFEDSIKILKNRGILNEGNAVKGVPDKAPVYNYPEEKLTTKYKKVVQEPEVDEQDGIYPATTLTDIPKEKVDKKVNNKSDGLEPIKANDTKNEMKKIRIIKDPKKKLAEIIDQPNNTIGINKLREAIKKIVNEILNESNYGSSNEHSFEDIEIKIKNRLYKFDADVHFEHDYTPGFKSNDYDQPNDTSKLDVYATIDEVYNVGVWDENSKEWIEIENPEIISMIKDKAPTYEFEEYFKDYIAPNLELDENQKKNIEIPSLKEAIFAIIRDMSNRIESNDLNLEFTSKDIDDVFYNFENKINHQYTNDEHDTILENVIVLLKKRGYNIK
jgi:hypothetical protein